jgi:putative transposase
VSLAAVIASQREQHGIPHAVSCRTLGVSQAWFYKWRRGDVSPPRAVRRAALAAEIARLFKAHRGTYGSPRITADLNDAGWKVSQNTVAQLMAERRLAARRKKKRRSLTRPGKGRWRAPDLVNRDFGAARINKKWFGDGTEITTDEGKLYLASVLDIASRRVLGFALSGHHDAQLAYGALAMAAAVRGGQVTGVIMHTDYGQRVHRGLLPRCLHQAGDPAVHGQARLSPGQRRHGVLALHPGVRAALAGALRDQGAGPDPDRRMDR